MTSTPANETTTARAFEVAVKSDNAGKFKECVKFVKQAHGKFDPYTKTWTVVTDGAELMAHLDRYSGDRASFYIGCFTITEVSVEEDEEV